MKKLGEGIIINCEVVASDGTTLTTPVPDIPPAVTVKFQYPG